MSSTVTITIGARNNTETGFARIRMAVRNLGRSLHENFGQAGRDSGMSFSHRMLNALSQGFASIGESGQGLTQGIGSALQESGKSPYVMAGVAALVAALAPAIGTAIGGALVLGIGGGLAGIGLMAAAKAKDVQKAFGKAKKEIGKDLSEAAKPLEPVLIHVADRATKMFDKMKGPLNKIFKDMAPHLEKFFDTLADAMEKAGRAAKPLTDAFDKLLDALGPVVAKTIEDIGESLAQLGVEFQNKDTIANFTDILKVLFGLIPIGIDTITMLTKVMRWYREGISAAIDKVSEFVGWIKKITGKTVKFAEKGIDKIIDGVRSVIGWVKRFVGKTIKLGQNGASTVISRVRDIINTIRRFVGKTVSVGVRGVSAAISAVQGLINRIRNLVGKTVSIGVNFFKNAGSNIASFLGFAHGGIIGAASGGPRSALTMVGEHGPELVSLPSGSRVHSNPDTQRMLGSASGGANRVQLEWVGTNGGDEFLSWLRKNIRIKGGNVQTVLGANR